MAIEIIEVITLQEYRALNLGVNYDDIKVKEAINTAFLQLNSVCDHNISKRWNLPDTDPLYLPEDKKQYAKEAFCLQTTWNLKNNLNMGSMGSQQTSLGDWSHSYNNPKDKEVICPGVLDLLQQAGLYKSVVGKSMNVLNRPFGVPPFGPEPIEGDVADLAFVRWGEANAKFLPKYLGIEYRNLILYVDSNGYIRTKDINDFNYQTRIDNALITEDKTIVGAINYLASHGSGINWDTEPTAEHGEGYAVTSEGIKTYVDNNLELKQNIIDTSLATTEKRIVPAINEVVGNMEYLAQEVGYVSDDLLVERTQRQSADSALQTEKQDKTDNNLQTTIKTVVGAINELKAQIEGLKIPVGGFFTSTTNYTPQELHDLLGYGTWENICDSTQQDYLYLKGIKSTTTANINIKWESLPNVSANLNIYGDSGAGYFSGSSTDQALYPGGTSTTKYLQASNSQSNQSRHNIYLDLSKSNAIYQNGANVHPTHLEVYIYRRIA